MLIGGIWVSFADAGGHGPAGLLHHVEVASIGAQRLAEVQMAQLSAVHHIEQIAHTPVMKMKYMIFLVDVNHNMFLLLKWFDRALRHCFRTAHRQICRLGS